MESSPFLSRMGKQGLESCDSLRIMKTGLQDRVGSGSPTPCKLEAAGRAGGCSGGPCECHVTEPFQEAGDSGLRPPYPLAGGLDEVFLPGDPSCPSVSSR